MKLVQFLKNSKVALGIETENGIVDAAVEGARRGLQVPRTMIQAIRHGSMATDVLQKLADGAVNFVQNPPAAPAVTGMERILCIGLNYRQHAMECGLDLPERPVPFCKFSNALSAHRDTVRLDPAYREYDYEAELVVVMGRPARNVSAEDALDYVFGYTCGNDLSTRDLQFARGGQWLLSKTFDGFAPLGPCVVTADSLDPSDLAISSTVNGDLRQNSRTSDLIFSVPELIADLSRHFTLEPGDVIFTGTPQGVMHGWSADKKQWLKPGDRVDVTIEGIGTLTTTFC